MFIHTKDKIEIQMIPDGNFQYSISIAVDCMDLLNITNFHICLYNGGMKIQDVK